jgi:hypothetical protein
MTPLDAFLIGIIVTLLFNRQRPPDPPTRQLPP